MSVRNTILANIETELKKIKKAGGYNVNCKTISRNASSMATLSESATPAIWIDDSGDETAYLPIGTNRRQSMPLTLRGWIIRTEFLSEVFNDFIADIRKVFYAANLGANVIDWDFGPLRIEAAPKDIYFEYEMAIDYYYAEASP